MIPQDIGGLAANAVKKSIMTSKYLSQFISENDTEPTWDGFVYIYNREEKTNADLYGRVPVQVKGKECADLSHDQITKSVEIAHLKSYLSDGGVIFFLVYIADGGNADRIYYAPLTSSVLKTLLAECKPTQHEKTISLKPFPTKPEERTDIFRRFYLQYRNIVGQDSVDEFIQMSPDADYLKVNLLKPYSFLMSRYLSHYIYRKIGSLQKKDFYQPSRFCVDYQRTIFHDIMQPISSFLSGDLKSWLNENKIVLQNHQTHDKAEKKKARSPEQISTLVIQGEQCTGKSTLVAQIIHSIDTGVLPFRKVYLLSFSERDLRSISLSCRSICEYLKISYTDLDNNALLVIDAIDESEWFQQNASNRVDELINEMMSLDCKIIITGRIGYLDVKDSEVLDIQLHPFSEQQALTWIQIFQQAFPHKNTANIEAYIQNLMSLNRRAKRAEMEDNDRLRGIAVDERFSAKPLSPEEKNLLRTAEVILTPHVMELCIDHQVSITDISSMAQLYTLVFLPAAYKSLLHNQYSISPRKVSSKDEFRLLKAATSIAIQCLSRKSNSISQEELETCIRDPELIPMVCTKYLMTKSADRYMFVHQSIPAFLSARYFYERFSVPDDQITDEAVLEWLWGIAESGDVLTEDVQDYIRFFAQSSENQAAARISRMLLRFLDYDLCGTVDSETPMPKLEARRQILCDSLVRLYGAFCVQKFDRIMGLPFFNQFSIAQQKQLLRLLSDPGIKATKSMGFCKLQELEMHGLNLGGADLHCRYIHKMRLHGARLCGTNLTDAYIRDCDLSLSCLDRAKSKVVQYYNSILCGCSFRNAVLNGSIFTNCNLANADLRGARIFSVKFENCILAGMKVDITHLKELRYMDHNYVQQHRIQVYLGDELLTGQRFLEEYSKVRPIRAISVPNHFF